ncbi:MAG: hypothetical protein COW88_00285 [Candidatus Lloydbacteria bacterium CG22_combo_CG10-13_8_21_14_all_47_15]|uniref:O-antigen ligase-related domain-containing protein n=1 Tax=Candidatus Lloydbacteria bacterium CG22_combo_CG10-13_8_21_14_all_47_15 TaxID=1974635 RepID=A0A2H0CXA6_9BACT|nr:MAG: hypothetical protein COW88_00285 [Candidatus Lloydbacteria bacterium CG22_combo_CG10-13_8_21_14_all_47_15]
MVRNMSQNTINTALRWIILTGIFIIPFVPLIVSPSMFFPFITGKNFTFRILVEIVFAVWLVLMYRDASYRPKFSWMFAAIAGFIGVMTFADLFGENPIKSIWSNFERMEGLVALLHLGAYAIVAGTTLRTEYLWGVFAHTSLGASLIVGSYAALQLVGSVATHQGSRLDATLGNASYLAVYMLFHIFIAAFLWARQAERPWAKWVYAPIILFETFILYHTATRGTILGLLGGTLVAALLVSIFGRDTPRVRKIAVGFIAAVVLIVGSFLAVKDAQFVKDSPVLSRFASISLEERTTQSRFIIWGMAFEGFKEHPILGWGQENFNIVFNKFFKPVLYKQEPWFDRAHNVFLDWLTAGGALGLLSYLSLFGAALWVIWRVGALSVVERSILTGLLAAYFAHNFFVFDNIVSYILFFSFLGYMTSVGHRVRAAETDATIIEPPSHVASSIVASIVIASLMFSIYFINIRGVLAAQTLLRAISQQETVDGNFALFKKATSYHYATQEVREQLLRFASDVGRANIPQETKNEILTYAVNEMAKQIQIQPNDTRLLLFYGSFMDQLGQREQAIELLTEARRTSPGKQLVWIGLGNTYLNQGDYETMIEVFREGYELETTNQRMHLAYAIGAIYADRRDIEKELLTEDFETYYIWRDAVVNAYASQKRFPELVAIWEKRVSAQPDNAQYNLSLGAAYAQNGEFRKAIGQIQKTIELNPDFKETGEYYISELRAGRLP